MRRTLLMLLLTLLAGMLINLGIAWIIAGTTPLTLQKWSPGLLRRDLAHNAEWIEPPPSGWPAAAADYEWEGGGLRIRQAWAGIVHLPDRANLLKGPTLGMTRVQVGVPLPAMEWFTTYDTRATPTAAWIPANDSIWRNGIALPWSGNNPDSARLPMRPVPIGFLVNTVFFMSAIWGVVIGVATIRSRRRRSIGRCGRCGYALDGIPDVPGTPKRCPECGSLV